MIDRSTPFLAKKNSLHIITIIFIVSFILLSSLVYKYTYDYALDEASKRIENMLITDFRGTKYMLFLFSLT